MFLNIALSLNKIQYFQGHINLIMLIYLYFGLNADKQSVCNDLLVLSLKWRYDVMLNESPIYVWMILWVNS